jgi:hypothetical protein
MFDLIGLPAAANLPAVRWKLINLERLMEKNPEKHAAQPAALEAGIARRDAITDGRVVS